MIQRNGIVRTNYGTGPYKIVDISGPCTCPEYIYRMDGDDTPSEEHYHLTCVDADHHPRWSRGNSWLNGYRLDGTSVWDDDYLIFEGIAKGETMDLFEGQ